MDDRELLERAAYATGRNLLWPPLWGDPMPIFDITDDDRRKLWNPLADDGDALRLAVGVGAALKATSGMTTVIIASAQVAMSESHGADANAATRRAIVRAVAALAPETI